MHIEIYIHIYTTKLTYTYSHTKNLSLKTKTQLFFSINRLQSSFRSQTQKASMLLSSKCNYRSSENVWRSKLDCVSLPNYTQEIKSQDCHPRQNILHSLLMYISQYLPLLSIRTSLRTSTTLESIVANYHVFFFFFFF